MSYSAFPDVEDSRFMAGGDYYWISFNESVPDHGGDLTIDWPGTSFTSTTASEDAQSVKLAVRGCFGCPTHSFAWPANERRQLTLPGAITNTKQASMSIALLSGNGTELWSHVVGLQDVQPKYARNSFAAILTLRVDNVLQSVAIHAVATQLNYTCQWATEAQVFDNPPLQASSRKLVTTVLQAPIQFSTPWGWRCQVPIEFDRRMRPAVEYFTMSVLVGSGPETLPPTDGVAIVKRTKSRVLSIPSVSDCLRPGSSLHIIGVFDTSSMYSCDFGQGSPNSIFVGSSRQVRPQSQWDLLCEIPTSITRNQFIYLREVTLWEWPDDLSSEPKRVLVDGAFFYSYCPSVFWYYSETFWYEVLAAVALLAAVVYAAVVITRRRVRNAYNALELTNVM